MRYEVIKTKRFKTAYKRVSQLPGFKKTTFGKAVRTLAEGKSLEAKYRDHSLKGKLASFRECHLAPDILLLYQVDDGLLILSLVSIGNHGQLFK